ncbi:MAG: hypothetical protein LC656_11805 [Sphingomonadales bacterium]|nr:hypothetical protein [Sphingomonadales bacterium]
MQRPVDAGVRSRLAALIDEARAGEAAFRMAYGPAERAAGAAGAPQSESWIAAQELLSALEAARAPTSRAVGEIDALAGERVHGTGGIGASDLTAIRAAADEVGALDQRQAAEIKALTARLSH